ncbi:MAG: bifunctional folylpolyglutamate synthase/dihydrofolate synthase [Eubacterium sp.]|nr:bifunctional folylpolyglutamate synthase/dihydrofolate synthase [Eubacterium sp.]
MKEALEYLKKISTLGSVLGLESIKELLNRLGNPQQQLKVVHIAGTNGKGSTLTFLQNILQEAGYQVGRYSSPAVFEFREMFQIGNEYISEETFCELLFRVKDACDEMVAEGLNHPTEFEIETAVAFLFFAEHPCDVVLIECGMGGETDATNVFSKVLCSILATISLDHMKFLGDTVEEIASVKAGIIKENCPVVSSRQEEKVSRVIKQKAKEKNALYRCAGKACQKGEKAAYVSTTGKQYSFKMSMLGSYQLFNVATAIEVAEVLGKQGFSLENAIEKGIENAKWPGRMEQICEQPVIYMDGAHNPGAVKELKDSIELYFTNQRITFIMGVLADKDFEKEVEMIADKAVSIYTITPENPRALSAEKLAQTVGKYHENVVSTNSLEEAIAYAKQDVLNKKSDMILAFGSLSYLGKLKKLVREESNS